MASVDTTHQHVGHPGTHTALSHEAPKHNFIQLFISPSDASIKWDSFEQFCVWQLLCAEGPDPQSVIPALTDLNPEGQLINGVPIVFMAN